MYVYIYKYTKNDGPGVFNILIVGTGTVDLLKENSFISYQSTKHRLLSFSETTSFFFPQQSWVLALGLVAARSLFNPPL